MLSLFEFQVENQARQRVRPAVQLLSATSALAMERYLGRHEEASFLRIVDNGFDVLNAGHRTDVKPFRRGYSGTPEQEAALTAPAAGGGGTEGRHRQTSLPIPERSPGGHTIREGPAEGFTGAARARPVCLDPPPNAG